VAPFPFSPACCSFNRSNWIFLKIRSQQRRQSFTIWAPSLPISDDMNSSPFVFVTTHALYLSFDQFFFVSSVSSLMGFIDWDMIRASSTRSDFKSLAKGEFCDKYVCNELRFSRYWFKTKLLSSSIVPFFIGSKAIGGLNKFLSDVSCRFEVSVSPCPQHWGTDIASNIFPNSKGGSTFEPSSVELGLVGCGIWDRMWSKGKCRTAEGKCAVCTASGWASIRLAVARSMSEATWDFSSCWEYVFRPKARRWLFANLENAALGRPENLNEDSNSSKSKPEKASYG